MAQSQLILEIDKAFNCRKCGRPGTVRMGTAHGELNGRYCIKCFARKLEAAIIYQQIRAGEFSE